MCGRIDFYSNKKVKCWRTSKVIRNTRERGRFHLEDAVKHLHVAFAPIFLISIPFALAAEPVRVGGYFCDTRQDQMAFLSLRVAGENEIMAANAVNKSAGKQTCADYNSVSAIPGVENVVTTDGLVLKVQSFTFLLENAEKWAGTFFGMLNQVADKNI